MAETETFAFHPKINNLISFNNNHPDKNIFLIQLISFAIDALDKIRFESLTDRSKLDAQPELFIRIIPDKANNTLTIVDSGIGMTKADLVNLCVVKRSARDNVRFFTTYLAAKKVIVTTKHNDDEQYVWESQGDGYFTVTRDASGENLGRGTKITLFLKQDQLQFLEKRRLENLITKHFFDINYPVSLWIEKTTEMEISDDEEGKVDVVDEEEEKEKKKKKKIHEMSHEWHLVNKKQLIWKQKFAFKRFYIKDSLEITATIIVPKKPTFYMRKEILLFVDDFLIVDNYNKELIPEYLDFISGSVFVYLHDRPLDIFTEMFQQDKIVTVVRKNLVEKSFELLYEIAEIKEDYNKFYEAFSGRLKLGICRDRINQIKIAELLRYHSTKSGDEMTSLMEYVTRMKEGQNDIYYIIGESKKAIENSPFLEKFKKEGYEVLFMVDERDEHLLLDGLKEFEGKKFVSATKEGLKPDESEDEKKRKDELKERFDGLCKLMKDVLGDEVEDVVVPDRYVHSLCCIVTSENGKSGKKIMKINSMDPIMEGLMNRVEVDKNDKSVKDLISSLYYNANFTFLSEKMAGNFIQHD